MQIKRLFFIIVLPLFLSFKFPENLEVKGHKLKLQGQEEVTFLFFDIYKIAFYQSKNKKAQLLFLHYQKDISKDISNKGWAKGFEKVKGKEKAKNWIYQTTQSVKVGEEYKILKLGKKETYFIKNDKEIGKSQDPDVSFLAHYPWIGKKALDNSIKDALLGQ